MKTMPIRFSVLMPTYNQCAFIRRAIYSLMQQTHKEWELIIINDGCTDETEDFIADYLADERVTYIKNEENTGLGHALNQGLDVAKYEYIAYLPSDDFYFENHLESLADEFKKNKDFVLVYSGMQFELSDSLQSFPETKCDGQRMGYCLQLVQTTHRKTHDRWIERNEWTSEDLFALFWSKLTDKGVFASSATITCYWTQHPFQRHKIISERYGGGLNKMRSHYQTKRPIKLRISKEKFWDEQAIYADFRKKCVPCEQPLKILIVGELAYNPERIYALEQAGHKLYGLWAPNPSLSFCTVGPLPFGHVVDIDRNHWKEDISRIQPDIIYGLLNFGAINWCCEVMRAFPKIPFAWHMKEGPQVAIRAGLFPNLIYLYHHADLRIYLNKSVRKWYELFLPQTHRGISMVLDGDLPKADYFGKDFSDKLSLLDGEVHTLVVGRMIGINEKDLRFLSERHIHIHLYTENYHSSRSQLLEHYMKLFPNHFHLHDHIPPSGWCKEFSKYDAGWMHSVNSNNHGRTLHCTWDDLNFPARISTYMAAALPVIYKCNKEHVVAMEEQIHKLGIGISYNSLDELIAHLKDKKSVERARENVMKHRQFFSFDYHVPKLIEAFREIIKMKRQ